ncbi:MAG: ankyrin repeat domain-containing protein [Gemmatimonadota bacterium]
MSEEWLEGAFDAVRRGALGEVVDILDVHPDAVRARGEHDVTLLHAAAEQGHTQVVDVLLERGADVEAESAWGHTAFEWAANMNQRGTALHLRDRGAGRADVWLAAALGLMDEVAGYFDGAGLKDGAGRFPRAGARLDGWPADAAFRTGEAVSDALYIACRNGHLEVARFLRERGGDIQAKGYFGASALHWAAGGGHRDVVEWLVVEGADLSARDPEFDSTAAGWAREFGHDELGAWLDGASDGATG